MPRLTAELIAEAPQFTNPVKDWEIDLRGNKIAVIENLGATLDQFDTIDLSDNEVKKLEGFPLLRRLKNILASNNKICRIAEGLEQSLPSLETLVLVNNNLEKLEELEPLASVSTLQYLSLLRNPVTHKHNYRLFVIHNMPQLRVLDFKRIRQKEREQARRAYGGKKAESRKPKTFVPGGAATRSLPPPPPPPKPTGPSPQDIARIREAIANARSLDEVQNLEAMLKAGQIPGDMITNHHGGTHNQGGTGYEMEEEEAEG